ncbi:type II and III secretion system protein [Candidatus Comchoanobacter bicostacola]|uniref:Type II and III secretion system protein n=1 Tax=Candidatus Comchoanobacter bicostacola TaxID=2919598 RepID=A0ABY5DLA5_9GAMM|nr:type II and III secretion system protein [Candidatus Comchoanobacter bicostacola]UTC24565.1 type II and III secretion system protein [Candidatus Comchoanobacter bicostacola]
MTATASNSPSNRAKLSYVLHTVLLIHPNIVHAATFFGQSWISGTHEHLNAHAEKVDVASLLSNWCDVCNQQCTINHSLKQKISIHMDDTSCDKLLSSMCNASNIIARKETEGWRFFEQQNNWVAHQFQKRPVHEIKPLLSAMLGSSKKESLLIDPLTNTLWIPSQFYQIHAAYILSLDQPANSTPVILSWIYLKKQNTQTPTLYAPDDNTPLQWLLSTHVSIPWRRALSWLNTLEETGMITQVNHNYITLPPNGQTSFLYNENEPIEVYNKKGSLQQLNQSTGAKIKLSVLAHIDDAIFLNIDIQDSNHIKSSPSSMSGAEINTQCTLKKGESVVLGSIQKSNQSNIRQTGHLLNKIPIIRKLFSKRIQHQKTQSILIMISRPQDSIKMSRTPKKF